MSETPRTDAARLSVAERTDKNYLSERVDADFARKLELENQSLREQLYKSKAETMAWALGVEQSNTDIVDMLRDEFRRIIVLNEGEEINGICKRAINTIEQKVPVIVQLEQLRFQNQSLLADRSELLDVLRQLHDFQNGCPLEKYRANWALAMQRAVELFARLE